MKIYLTSVQPGLTAAWQKFCGDLENVAIHQGSIFDVPYDAVVSPANSFGFMDGGIDLLYSHHFGWHVQDRLQHQIQEFHHGELLVGAAEIVETGGDIPFLIAAPTMRVPMILRDSVNPYLAAGAALLLVKHGVFRSGRYEARPVAELVTCVAFPGLGTGIGRIGPAVCGHQVRAAIEDVLIGASGFPLNWADAQARHQQLFTTRVRDLQLE